MNKRLGMTYLWSLLFSVIAQIFFWGVFIFFDEFGMILGGNKTAKEDLGYKDGFENVNITDVFPRVMRMNGKYVESYGLTE